MAIYEIAAAYSFHAARNPGAVIAFDQGETVLFFKGAAVKASHDLSEPMYLGPCGQPEVTVSKERALAYRTRIQNAGGKFVMLKRGAGRIGWQVEAETRDFSKFIEAHTNWYDQALREIKNGCKHTHWMWFIFPQLKGLGTSHMAERFGIENLEEAKDFLRHPYLGRNLTTITKELLNHPDKFILDILGSEVDVMKLRSCLTLFGCCRTTEGNVFQRALDLFFAGEKDELTLKMIGVLPENESAEGG